MGYRRDELRFNGWGLSAKQFDLKGRDAEVWTFVEEVLQLDQLPSTPAHSLEEITLPEGALSESALDALRAETSADQVTTSAFERAFHAVGKSYYDLLRIRAGRLPGAPDAVVYPRNHDETQAILERCAELGIAVVPFGGGSSVVGGVEAARGESHEQLICLDTTAMTRILDVDEVSRVATVEAGIYGPELEEKLGQRGFTVGHFPQSFEFSTLGGWIAARGAGQHSYRYGAAAKLLVGARLATPSGEWSTAPFPNSAAGPDLNQLVAGSEGSLGVITEATVRIRPIAKARDFISFMFRDWTSGTEAVRLITQSDHGVATLRLSDVDETRFYGGFKQVLKPSRVQELGQRALGGIGYDRPCVLMVGFEGSDAAVKSAWRGVFRVATRSGGLYVGRGPGNSWYEKRFEMPYLRDPLMDKGVGIDTLETSTLWSNIPRLYARVSDAIHGAIEARGHRGIVLAHISHTYATGASLYFTFLFPRQLDDEVGQWRAIKDAASLAITENGGTISHHHGVGIDHAPWLTAEKGERGIAILDATKRCLDPSGIMNPGKLIP